ncbi:TerC family protein [Spirosoma foliorum]|uniref:DUF475 domain-containing protein n=1 Tax=Spirosoma foliorum TaxID=2710596 RepID=A0A7G5H2J7_9BACT|nr:DUF475 domain-containing protein [Spirosoma foliorum]QMW05339.1 DUF475 domain-containing protein [Spirosoma foliorum]
MEIIGLLLTLLNIALLECSLSLDNASVIALIVKDLKSEEREKARYYGLLGAMIFRGLSLFIVAWVIHFWPLKILGGLYLMRLGYTGLTPVIDSPEEGNVSWLSFLEKRMGKFWFTVLSVEVMDIVFSLDNLVAVVSMSSNFWVIFTGIAIGILAMRFASKIFSILLERYPQVEKMAFYVVIVLGIKIGVSGIADGFDIVWLLSILEGHATDAIFSVLIVGLFAYPVIASWFSGKQRVAH